MRSRGAKIEGLMLVGTTNTGGALGEVGLLVECVAFVGGSASEEVDCRGVGLLYSAKERGVQRLRWSEHSRRKVTVGDRPR